VNIADVSNPNFTRRMCTVAEWQEALGIIVHNIFEYVEHDLWFVYCRNGWL
jgi:hypothetical protein